MKDVERKQLVDDTLHDLADLMISQKFTDMPRWLDQDLSVSQIRVIYQLAFRGSLTISELARRLKVGKPAASTLIQRLVEEGLVERHDDLHDRRKTYIQLTQQGFSLVQQRREMGETKAQGWFRKMKDEELISLRDSLHALLKAIQALENDTTQAKDWVD